MRFVLAVLAVSLQLVLSEGAPATHKDRRSWYGGQITLLPESTQNCSIFLHPYCNGIGYSTALFPNRRDQNYDAALREFGDFASLLHSGCSAKLGTLLCFFYFPFCNVTQWQSTSLKTQNDFKPIMPCRETCQEVRNSCEGVLTAHGYSWPSHLDCSKEYFLPASGYKCANGTVTQTLIKEPKTVAPPTEGESGAGDRCQGENNNDLNSDCPNRTEQPTTNEPTEQPTTNEPTEQPTTNEPTEEPTMACTCPRCNVRDKCTANTFKRNEYTFAAKVTVLSTRNLDGTQTYSVHVLKQYSLKSEANGTMVLAPHMAEIIVLHANPHCCDSCPALRTGTTYLIGGYYQRSPSIQWHIRSDDSLASKWKVKYEKMQKWMENVNDYRLKQLQNGIEGR